MASQIPSPAPVSEDILEDDGFVTVYPPIKLSCEEDGPSDEEDVIEP